MSKIITVQMTNGFGNNIFQYTAARLLAQHCSAQLYAVPPTPDYYGIPDLESYGVVFTHDYPITPNTYSVSEDNYLQTFKSIPSNSHIHLSGYFEDYRFYLNNLDTIHSWFPTPDIRNDNALVLHMRTGDRLFMKNEFYSKPRVENYLKAIENFDFDEFHIVTDMPHWALTTGEELQNMKFHLHTPLANRVPISESVKYFNELVDGFAPLNPQIMPRTVGEDFNFIRSFKNTSNSTL